ncbi:CPBP family intramembrane metalloprotease [Duganella sp. FT92W]|uniref:CPBP family intramembrane metalloprotease n=1 Tax=Pseudoduganella rivuli TaxID=2666085 RepID=A0A7X2LRX4_9BURK|nr:CPBP family intramembrane metalloprotease [Pseudoduganella rivuli]
MQLERHQQFAITWALLPVIVIWQINGLYLASLAKISVPAFWLADLCQWILLPSLIVTALARKASLLPKHYGLDTAPHRWQALIVGALLVFITTYIAFVGTRNISWALLGHPPSYFSFPGVFPSGLMGSVIWIYSAVTAGIVESIFFIGLPWLLYRHVRAAPSRIAFALLATTVFAVAHWEQGPHVIIGAFFSNLVACFWYFLLGTLWPVAAGHILVDLVAFA